ncbi:polyprenyl synthetase family protein [Paenibacillus azoreducens]|uniref:Competence regulatory protein ComQ n=1 Tax=Paenibacillus azoreducens TaxID=116718 RepID=A0A919YFT3_9BACL|nr:polyprenyl synthetase family protein [Paenibacillus azoreducens]GIO49954.1 competence regulatory protein ComQ [Paenibacillus azoreducens]
MDDFKSRLMSELADQTKSFFKVEVLLEAALKSLKVKESESLLFGKLTVLHYRMFGGEGSGIYRAAAAVELMILGLDIIDDLQDEDHGGMPWHNLSKDIALNLAIGFLTLSQEVLLLCDFPLEHVHQSAVYLNRQVLTAINGQTLDLLNTARDEKDYLRMVEQKSAALLVCACMIGVIMATGRPDERVEEYAREVGIAAQIKNDYRDLLDWSNKNDFLRRKKTLPLLFLLSAAESEEERWIQDYFAGRLELEEVRDRSDEFAAIVERTGTTLYTSVRMRSHYYQFLDIIESMDVDIKWRDLMIEAAR